MPAAVDPLIRFHQKWESHDGGYETPCWRWTAGLNAAGYGVLRVNEASRLAYHWHWIWLNGPVLAGLQLDHKCTNRYCVNPDHLEPVTPQENVIRGRGPKAAQERGLAVTHCPKGHEYTEDNIYEDKTRSGNRARRCRTCVRARGKARYDRIKK